MAKRKPINVEKKITSPEKLNNYLKATSVTTWVLLGVVMAFLVGVLIWSHLAEVTYKIEGKATISSSEVRLEIDESRLSELKVGQIVYILDSKGEITSIDDDGMPVISGINLSDGEYEYTLIIKTINPIEYLLNR